MDRARKRTEKKLRSLEKRVKGVYANDPSLLRMLKRFEQYMNEVDEATHEAYLEYNNAEWGEMRDKAKRAYMEAVRRLTIENRMYNDMISRFTEVMAEVNQQALDVINAEMDDIYMLNYNQVAVDCKKVGIKVENDG